MKIAGNKMYIENLVDLEAEMCRYNCQTVEELNNFLWYNHGTMLVIKYKENII